MPSTAFFMYLCIDLIKIEHNVIKIKIKICKILRLIILLFLLLLVLLMELDSVQIQMYCYSQLFAELCLSKNEMLQKFTSFFSFFQNERLISRVFFKNKNSLPLNDKKRFDTLPKCFSQCFNCHVVKYPSSSVYCKIMIIIIIKNNK